jgi:hypothetical protein
MMHLNLLAAFTSLLGEVQGADINRSFELMGKGMLGIFIVMLLIYAVIVVLGRSTGKNKED